MDIIIGVWRAVLGKVVQNVRLRIWPVTLILRLVRKFWKLMDHSDIVMAKQTHPALTSAASVTCVFMEVSSLCYVTPWQSMPQCVSLTKLQFMPGGA